MSSDRGRVLIAEDDASLRLVMQRALEQAGLGVEGVDRLEAARRRLESEAFGAVVTDLRLPDGSGLELAREARRAGGSTPVILVTAYTDLDAAVGAFDAGAFDYLPKPFDLDELVALTRRALEARESPEAGGRRGGQLLLGESRAMQPVFKAIARLASAALPVLITGPTGSGKELVARALHRHGDRADRPFVAVNVAAIPRELLEAELFGHERGAFTGAHARRPGRFEQAAGGTLFLDEIGDMPQSLQSRLLRVLSEGEYYRVGGSEALRADARIIAATHQDLRARVAGGAFREDLLHRLDVVPIAVPPLAERREDIGPLAERFLARAAMEAGIPAKRLAPETLAALKTRDWPGNVRELENLCRRLTVLTAGPVIHPADLASETAGMPPGRPGADLDAAVASWFRANREALAGSLWPEAGRMVESRLIRLALEATGGHRGEAARLLGMGRNTLARKLRDDG